MALVTHDISCQLSRLQKKTLPGLRPGRARPRPASKCGTEKTCGQSGGSAPPAQSLSEKNKENC